jgi:multimeric flavodoxin WrbA
MEKVKILGIVGSPRKRGNTAKLVDKALEAVGAYSYTWEVQ